MAEFAIRLRDLHSHDAGEAVAGFDRPRVHPPATGWKPGRNPNGSPARRGGS